MKLDVQCTTDGNMHGHSPNLDPSWSDLEKLRWHAAIVQAHTGLDLSIGASDWSRNGVPQYGYFSISMRYGNTSSSHGPHNFGSAWTYLNGIESGAKAILEAGE